MTTSSAQLRKIKKPMIERRRRERINECLGQLKSLVLEATNKDESRYSKMEKADILEMTVSHLRSVQRCGNQRHRQQQQQQQLTDVDPSGRYVAGFRQCALEVSRYLSDSGTVVWDEDADLSCSLPQQQHQQVAVGSKLMRYLTSLMMQVSNATSVQPPSSPSSASSPSSCPSSPFNHSTAPVCCDFHIRSPAAHDDSFLPPEMTSSSSPVAYDNSSMSDSSSLYYQDTKLRHVGGGFETVQKLLPVSRRGSFASDDCVNLMLTSLAVDARHHVDNDATFVNNIPPSANSISGFADGDFTYSVGQPLENDDVIVSPPSVDNCEVDSVEEKYHSNSDVTEQAACWRPW